MEEQLALLECPFTWNLPDYPGRKEFLGKLQNKENQTDFLMNGFCVRIVECFETAQSGEIETAMRKVQECETELDEYPQVDQNKTIDKCLYKRASEALWHVLRSTEAHLAFKMSDLETVDKLMMQISPAKSFDDSNKAGLLGIKSRVLMEYGPYQTTGKAITYLRKSVVLDESVPLWHFYLGKCLARYRRANAYYDIPSREEVVELEKAFSSSKTPHKGVMLLETYGELLKFSYLKKLTPSNKAEIEHSIKDLLIFIQNCTSDEWYVYWRCALVAMKLQQKLVRKEEIKTLIDLAVESSDRNLNTAKCFLNSIQSKYYSVYEKNFLKALNFSKEAAEAGDFSSCIVVLQLKYKINEEEDLVPVIDQFLAQDNLNNVRNKLLLLKATYLMFVKNHVAEAMHLYIEVMKQNCKDYSLLNCRPNFNEVQSRATYNVYEILNRKLKELISCRKDKGDKFLNSYLDKVNEFKRKSLE